MRKFHSAVHMVWATDFFKSSFAELNKLSGAAQPQQLVTMIELCLNCSYTTFFFFFTINSPAFSNVKYLLFIGQTYSIDRDLE